jgi:erythronate-4-phosphate dehydrogenase
MLKIIVDENIVFAEEAFSAFGKVQLFPGRKLNNQILKDADILVVRSITKVDEELLKNTRIKFVGTATTGNDHVDQEYLKKKNIFFADAKGCNADSVAEYVITALMKIASEKNIILKNKTFSVIGVGNIGSRVMKLIETLGMHILKNDPPLERAEKANDFVSLDEALQADIISFHVPLTIDGRDKTYHLLNSQNLKRLKDNSILINSSRGEVIDNKALQEITYSKKLKLIIDVWENEPEINKELLKNSEIGTAHIAGYSYEGKLNGTRMIFNALRKFLGEEKNWNPVLPSIENPVQRLTSMGGIENNLYHLFKSIYNIDDDDSGLRKILKMDNINSANHFDKLRKEYKVRREFSNYTVLPTQKEAEIKKMLENFRFEVKLI